MSLRNNIDRHGFFRAVVARMLQALEQHVGLHIWSINVRPLAESFDIPPEHSDKLRIARLDLEETLRAAEQDDLQLSANFVRAAFARGDICVGAFDHERLVAYTWRSTSVAPITLDLWIRIDVRPQAYGYKSFVHPGYRGRRLNDSVGRYCDPLLFQMGIKHRIAYIDLHNLSSIRGTFRDPKTQRIGYAGYRKRDSNYWTFRTKGVRDYLSFEVRT
ncbi:MAG: hypothetical protein ACR2PZ_13210 [Pseudomonadales bacterium]